MRVCSGDRWGGGGVITYYLRKTLIEGGKVISNNGLFQQV